MGEFACLTTVILAPLRKEWGLHAGSATSLPVAPGASYRSTFTVCESAAEGPLFGATSRFLVEAFLIKKSSKEPQRYADFSRERGPLPPDTIVFEIFMWSTVEEYAILAPKRVSGLPEILGFLKKAFVAPGYHHL